MGRGRNILKSWKSSLSSHKPSQQIVPVPVDEPVATTPLSTVPELASNSINDPSNVITSQLHNDAVTPPPSEAPIVLTGLIPLNSNTPIPDTYSEGTFPVDLIAVHGLNGGAYSTWTHPQNGMMWLRDLLPQELPGARVYSFGYASKVFSLDTSGFEDFARELLEGIRTQRGTASLQRRPIIFICHSMGGIVVKKALNITKVDDKRYAPILAATSTILFLATPHGGSATADFSSVLASIGNIALVGGLPRFRKDLIDSLKQNSKDLMDIARDFRNLTQHIKIYSFFEKAKIVGLRDLIVDQKSGSMNSFGEIVIPMGGCDHRSICRFESAQSVGYENISAVLHEVADDVTNKVHNDILVDDQPCLQSLAYSDLHQKGTHYIRQLNSCKWVLKHSTYRDFISTNSPCPMLLIKGNAGSGKSTLMAFLHSTHAKLPTYAQDICLTFFFNRYGSPLQRSKLGMLRTLLWEIYQQSIDARNIIFSRWTKKESGLGSSWSWGMNELAELLEEVLCRQRREVYIFVDAVDEAADEGGTRAGQPILDYFRLLSTNVLEAGGKVRICASCRHYPVYSAGPGALEIVVEHSNGRDLVQFMQSQLENGVQDWTSFPEIERKNLEDAITRTARGNFLWVVLRLPKIVKGLNDGAYEIRNLRDLISTESNELFGMYHNILRNDIDENAKDGAVLFLQWVCLAERPLSVEELRFAMSCDQLKDHGLKRCEDIDDFVRTNERMEKLVKSLSGGLAAVHSHGNRRIVSLFHTTVYDYLRDQGLSMLLETSNIGFAMPHINKHVLGASQNRLSKLCLRYLVQEDLLEKASRDRHETIKEYAFVEYATKYWPVHAESAERCGISQEDLVGVLESQSKFFEIWKMLYFAIDHSHPKCPQRHIFDPIHVASYWNLQTMLLLLLENGIWVDETDNGGNTALHNACYYGYEEMVEILIEHKADISAKNMSESTPLELAATQGYEQIVRLLLRKGAGVNDPTGFNGNALEAAAQKGNVALITMLIRSGADVNAHAGYWGNALKRAAYGGNLEIVQLLLSHNVDVNQEGGVHGTALHAAVMGPEETSEKIVRLLLDAGANPNICGCELGNSCQAAAERCSLSLVKLLLQHGAEINACDGEYGTPLHAACAQDDEELAGFLIERGADINKEGGRYLSPLQAAAKCGSCHLVKILLEKGANVHAFGGMFGGALQAAAASPGPEVVPLLIAAGARRDIRGGYYDNLLQAAVYARNFTLAKLLLKEGSDINQQGGQFGNALQASITTLEEGFVKFLLENGADVNAQGGEYGTPLQAAVFYERESIVRLLINHGADVNIVIAGNGSFALQLAARRSKPGIVKLLLDSGAEVNLHGGGWRGTALHEAVVSDNIRIVELLLDRGARMEMEAGFFGNAFEAAIASLNMRNYLLSRMVPNHKGVELHDGGTSGTVSPPLADP